MSLRDKSLENCLLSVQVQLRRVFCRQSSGYERTSGLEKERKTPRTHAKAYVIILYFAHGIEDGGNESESHPGNQDVAITSSWSSPARPALFEIVALPPPEFEVITPGVVVFSARGFNEHVGAARDRVVAVQETTTSSVTKVNIKVERGTRCAAIMIRERCDKRKRKIWGRGNRSCVCDEIWGCLNTGNASVSSYNQRGPQGEGQRSYIPRMNGADPQRIRNDGKGNLDLILLVNGCWGRRRR